MAASSDRGWPTADGRLRLIGASRTKLASARVKRLAAVLSLTSRSTNRCEMQLTAVVCCRQSLRGSTQGAALFAAALEASPRSSRLARGWTWKATVDLACIPNPTTTLNAMNGFGSGSGGHRKWRRTISIQAAILCSVIKSNPAKAAARRSDGRVRDAALRSGRAQSR